MVTPTSIACVFSVLTSSPIAWAIFLFPYIIPDRSIHGHLFPYIITDRSIHGHLFDTAPDCLHFMRKLHQFRGLDFVETEGKKLEVI
jgi:hypothetical protein